MFLSFDVYFPILKEICPVKKKKKKQVYLFIQSLPLYTVRSDILCYRNTALQSDL